MRCNASGSFEMVLVYLPQSDPELCAEVEVLVVRCLYSECLIALSILLEGLKDLSEA